MILVAVVFLSRMQTQFHMYFLANPGGTMIIARHKHKYTTVGVQSVISLPIP